MATATATVTQSTKLRSYYSLTGEGNTNNIIKSWDEPFENIITKGPYKAVLG